MSERPRILALFGGVVLLGQERGNIEALAALRDQGCEVLCLISDAPWNTQVPRVLDERGLAWRKVPYVHLRLRGKGNLLNFVMRNPGAFVRANVRALAIDREFRATHFHAMNIAYVLNFWMFLKLRWQKPVIFRVGDEPPDKGRWHLLWRISIRRAKTFVAISKFIRGRLIECGVRPSMIEVIYNRPRNLSPLHNQKSSDLKENAEFFYFIYVGQMIEEKGVGILISGFSAISGEYPAARLKIVGRISDWTGDVWARDLRESIIKNNELCDRVEFTGFREDVPSMLKSAGVLIVPSVINEALGNVVLEAKQEGRPAIVFPRGGLPEMIQHGVDGLICHDATQEALVEAMRVYLDRPELMNEHGEAARRSLERFDVEGFAERWLKVYEAAATR